MGLFERFRGTSPNKKNGKPSKGAIQQVSELIGRVFYQWRYQPPQRISVDWTEPDYEFWDKLRYGQQYGYEIGGLFAKPITEIISAWVLGDGFTIDTDNEDTNEALSDMISECLDMLNEWYQDSIGLGNSYMVVNADGTMQIVPSSMVEIKTAEDNFREIVKATIRTLDAENGVLIEDIYTATERTVRISKGYDSGRASERYESTAYAQSDETTYPNTIGRIPVVLLPNNRTANEVLGRPEFEPLLTLFAEYDDVIRKGLDGVKIMGNPIPVVNGVQDANQSKNASAQYSQSYDDNRGVSSSTDVMELSPTEMFFTTGNFQFAAPGNFTGNTKDMLKKLFQVMLQHSQIPEWVWGGAISSSMASVEAQMPAFVKFIQGKRRKLEKPLKQLIEIYLLTIAQFTPNIVTDEYIKIEWSELAPDDKEIQLKWVEYLVSQGAMTRETALRLSNTVDNIAEEIQTAREQILEDVQSEKDEIEALVRKVLDLEVPVQQAWEEMGYKPDKIAEFKRMRTREQAMRLRDASKRLSSKNQDTPVNDNTAIPNNAEDVLVNKMLEVV